MKNHKRLLVTVTVLLLAVPTLTALGSFPWGSISVTPNTGLANGQTVQVSGSAFQKNLELRIIECGPTQPLPPQGGFVEAICTDYSVAVTTDANGNFSAQDFTVSTVIQGSRREHGHSVPTTYDCLARNDCHIHVFAPIRGVASANQDLSFSP